jgi:hypothetical protein
MVCLLALFTAELPFMPLFFAQMESGIMRSLVKIAILLCKDSCKSNAKI